MIDTDDPNQYSLDLGDKLQKWKKIAEDMVKEWNHLSGSSCQIYSTHNQDVFWLGVRTFVYDTDHDRIHKVDYETAKYIYQNVRGFGDYFNKLRERIASEGAA